MAKILSKYSRSEDVTQQNVVYQSAKEYSAAVARGIKAPTPGDLERPYTFRNWYDRQLGISPGQEYLGYNNYLKDWYETRKNTNPVEIDTREAYEQLMGQLEPSFKTKEEQDFIKNLNFNNSADLVDAIPLYSSKLIDIAKYLCVKRDTIKRAKLKYNIVGSNQTLSLLFQEYLLKAFTKNKSENEYTIINDLNIAGELPDLSAVNGEFSFEIEELYDDTNYADKDPSMGPREYFPQTNKTIDFLATQNLTINDYDWLYSTGMAQLCADNPLLWVLDDVLNLYELSAFPLSAIDDTVNNTLNEYNQIALASKYLGENQYIISGGYYVADEKTYTYNMSAGNNWFYWPSGGNIYDNDNSLSHLFEPIKIQATQLKQFGTATDNYKTSDKIIISDGSQINAAWLQKGKTTPTNFTMSAMLLPGETRFAFPYPGFGVSGEDIEWEGRETSNLNQTILFLDEQYKKAVYSAYWNTSTPSSAIQTSISINDTELINSLAHAEKTPWTADTITIRPRIRETNNESVYTGSQESAFLYKVDKTDLPIFNGETNVRWPYEKYTTLPVLTGSMHLQIGTDDPINPVCDPINIASLPLSHFRGAVAGNTPDASDIIYHLDGPNGNIIAGAWFSGRPFSKTFSCTPNNKSYKSTKQIGLYLNISAGDNSPFIWYDNSAGNPNNFIFHIPHRTDCELGKKVNSLDLEELAYEWDKCNCQSIWFSPLGHPGTEITDHNTSTDIIVKHNCFDGQFSLETWRGADGQTYKNSSDCVWFKTNTNFGWSDGQWVRADNSSASVADFFQPDNIYIYVRYNAGAPIISNKIYNNTADNASWKALRKSPQGSWIDSNTTSQLILKAGNYYKYIHRDYLTTTIETISSFTAFSEQDTVISTPTVSAFVNNNNGLIWSTYSQLATGTSTEISWPRTYHEDANVTTSEFMSAFSISVTPPGSTSPTEISKRASTRYSPKDVGTHAFTAIGYKTNGTSETRSFSIQAVNSTTTVNVTSVSSTLVPFTTSVIASSISLQTNSTEFVLNVPLSGWNYDPDEALAGYEIGYSEGIPGCKPFWGVNTLTSEEVSRYKATMFSGGIPRKEGTYLWITQPKVSTITLSSDIFVLYDRKTNERIVWTQPIEQNIFDTSENKWCDLLVDTTDIINISSILSNSFINLGVTATNDESELRLAMVNDGHLQINYFAQNPFTWSISLTNTSLGIPPTGGLWVPIVSGDLITAATPYAHLLNKHFPSFASVPYIENIHPEAEFGGFMTPKYLGVSTTLSKYNENVLDTTESRKFINVNPKAQIFQRLNAFNKDRGLTHTTQYTPVTTLSVDSSWMKANVTEGKRAGVINDAIKHQELVPYQTSYESAGLNKHGVVKQEDDLESFGKVMNKLKGAEMQQWKQDLFGNNFGLYKFYDLDLSIKLNTPHPFCINKNYDLLAQVTRKRIIDENIPLFSYTWQIDDNEPKLVFVNDWDYNVYNNLSFSDYNDHTVRVTVTDIQGNTAIDVANIKIESCMPITPLSTIITGPTAVCYGDIHVYTAHVSPQQMPIIDVKSHTWLYNNDVIATYELPRQGLNSSSTVSTSMTSIGDHDLKVIVEDISGNTVEADLLVKAYRCTDLGITFNGPQEVCTNVGYEYRAAATSLNCTIDGCIPIVEYRLTGPGIDITQPAYDDDAGRFFPIIFNSLGSKTLIATITDANGNSASQQLTVNVIDCLPDDDFYNIQLRGPVSVCENTTHTYTANAIGGSGATIEYIRWKLNGNIIATDTSGNTTSTQSITFPAGITSPSTVIAEIRSTIGLISEDKSASLEVDVEDCSTSGTIELNIINPICFPLSYTFTAVANVNNISVTRWEWTFTYNATQEQKFTSYDTSDTQSTATINPCTDFNSSRPSASQTKPFTVKVKVYFDDGTTREITRSFNVVNCFTRHISSSISGETHQCAGQSVVYTIDETTNCCPELQIIRREWKIGTDDWVVGTRTRTITAPTAGNSTIIQTRITDSCGYQSTASKTLYGCACNASSVSELIKDTDTADNICYGASRTYTASLTRGRDDNGGAGCRTLSWNTSWTNGKGIKWEILVGGSVVSTVERTLTSTATSATANLTNPAAATFQIRVSVRDELGNTRTRTLNMTADRCIENGCVEILNTFKNFIESDANCKVDDSSVQSFNMTNVGNDSALITVVSNTNTVWLPTHGSNTISKIKLNNVNDANNRITFLGNFYTSSYSSSNPSRTTVIPEESYSVWVGCRATNELVYFDNNHFGTLQPGVNTNADSTTPWTYGHDAALATVICLGKKLVGGRAVDDDEYVTVVKGTDIRRLADASDHYYHLVNRHGSINNGIRAVTHVTNSTTYGTATIWAQYQEKLRWYKIPSSIAYATNTGSYRVSRVNVPDTTDKAYGAVTNKLKWIWWSWLNGNIGTFRNDIPDDGTAISSHDGRVYGVSIYQDRYVMYSHGYDNNGTTYNYLTIIDSTCPSVISKLRSSDFIEKTRTFSEFQNATICHIKNGKAYWRGDSTDPIDPNGQTYPTGINNTYYPVKKLKMPFALRPRQSTVLDGLIYIAGYTKGAYAVSNYKFSNSSASNDVMFSGSSINQKVITAAVQSYNYAGPAWGGIAPTQDSQGNKVITMLSTHNTTGGLQLFDVTNRNISDSLNGINTGQFPNKYNYTNFTGFKEDQVTEAEYGYLGFTIDPTDGSGSSCVVTDPNDTSIRYTGVSAQFEVFNPEGYPSPRSAPLTAVIEAGGQTATWVRSAGSTVTTSNLTINFSPVYINPTNDEQINVTIRLYRDLSSFGENEYPKSIKINWIKTCFEYTPP